MFVTPMISVYYPDFDRRQAAYSASREGASRISSRSSDASSVHRPSSTSSNNSNSRRSRSSVSSIDANVASKHHKAPARVSFQLPRPLQPFHKQALSQQHAQSPSTSRRSQEQPPSSPRARPPSSQKLRKRLPPSSPKLEPPTSPKPQAPPRPPRPDEATPRRSQSSAAAVPPPAPAPIEGVQWQCSDLLVRCKTEVYHVDRTIMCYHSRWFARVCAIMCSPKVSKSVIDLSADNPDAVAAMMQYCYQLDYTDEHVDPDCAIQEVADLRPHVDIYMLAERYGMSGLKRLALEKFEDLATTMLKVSGDEERFLRVVRTMYDPSRRANVDEMRLTAVKICADHVEGFISGKDETMAMVFESMDSLPEFRADLFEEIALRWEMT